MMTHRTLGMMTLVAVFSTACGAWATRPCPPDVNCDGNVGVPDLLNVIANWGGSGVPADVNHDGTVGVPDLLAVISAWGPCQLNFGPAYPNAEAHQIGLEMLGEGGSLTLPEAQYDRIARDLGLIRAARPELASQPHSQAWVPNQVLASVGSLQSPEFQCMSVYYQVTNVQHLFSNWYTITVAGKVNVPKLAQAMMASGGVNFAEPNGMIGGQNYWRPSEQGQGVWRWDIDDGWHDCFDGCDCHREYVIFTDPAGNVTVQSVTEWGMPWCNFQQ